VLDTPIQGILNSDRSRFQKDHFLPRLLDCTRDAAITAADVEKGAGWGNCRIVSRRQRFRCWNQKDESSISKHKEFPSSGYATLDSVGEVHQPSWVRSRSGAILCRSDAVILELSVSVHSALRAGIFEAPRLTDPMWIWKGLGKRLPRAFVVIPMSLPGRPSARLRPRRARFRFTWQSYCNSGFHAARGDSWSSIVGETDA
jgi:hypothetical protein